MNYEDEVYGKVLIREPVLQELLESAALQRLKGVLQHGITGLIGITRATTRFEHSVGTMLVVRKLGGALEEQIAALIHDVSHTAFSHVIDYVFHGHVEQNYHDAMKETFISTSDIPAILAKWSYDWMDFLNEDQFPLLEQPAPALCADRIDYFLRDALGLKLATGDQVAWAFSHLSVRSDRIVVDDFEAAKWFGYTYIEADRSSWANFREVALYELTAMAIRRGMDIGEIQDSDFWGGDEDLWAKLKQIDDPIVQERMSKINKTTDFVWDDEDSDFTVSTKIRTIDPDVFDGTRERKLSSLDPLFEKRRREYLESSRGNWPIRIVSR